mmetsp:Transcript_24194/g.78849  ORF Transcript_24194/g.78849 Transcript_24194/m.78849 type:complete len:346 (+) Transcript_24194:2073-3110(+)
MQVNGCASRPIPAAKQRSHKSKSSFMSDLCRRPTIGSALHPSHWTPWCSTTKAFLGRRGGGCDSGGASGARISGVGRGVVGCCGDDVIVASATGGAGGCTAAAAAAAADDDAAAAVGVPTFEGDGAEAASADPSPLAAGRASFKREGRRTLLSSAPANRSSSSSGCPTLPNTNSRSTCAPGNSPRLPSKLASCIVGSVSAGPRDGPGCRSGGGTSLFVSVTSGGRATRWSTASSRASISTMVCASVSTRPRKSKRCCRCGMPERPSRTLLNSPTVVVGEVRTRCSTYSEREAAEAASTRTLRTTVAVASGGGADAAAAGASPASGTPAPGRAETATPSDVVVSGA